MLTAVERLRAISNLDLIWTNLNQNKIYHLVWEDDDVDSGGEGKEQFKFRFNFDKLKCMSMLTAEERVWSI